MDGLARKRARMADRRLSIIRRLQPKSPPLLPESHSRFSEGQTAAGPTAPVTFNATLVPDNAAAVWGGSSRWSPAMSLGPITGWDCHDAIKATSFASRDRGHYAAATPNPDFSFPIVTQPDDVFGISGNDDSIGHCDSSSANPFEKWQTSTHVSPLPFVSFFNHPCVSYTAVHTNPRPHIQPMAAIVPLSLGSEVADLNSGFTSTGFASASIENSLVDPPGAPTFHQVLSHIAEECSLEPTFEYPATQYHPAHALNVASSHDEHDMRFVSHNASRYNEKTSGFPINPVIAAPFSPQSTSHVPDALGLKIASELAVADSENPISNHNKVVLSRDRPERSRRPRGQLLPKDREETSRTRKWKACIRCRMQKIRCIPDPHKPKTEYCLCCRKVLVLETKKVIHRIPCLRWNLNEVVLFRVGELGFTKRWTGVCVENIPLDDWADERVHTIAVRTTMLPCDSIPLKVRRYKPNITDNEHRFLGCGDTGLVQIDITPYALADVDATSEDHRQFIKGNAEAAVHRFVEDTTVSEYVRRTFSVALRHGAKAMHKEFGKAKGDPAKLFRSYFRLWLASRFTLGTAYIVNGNEHLNESMYVSRMVTTQFYAIGYKHVLVKLKREVLDELWLLMQKRTDGTFFTVYLIVFMMLHEVSVACQDRRRRAEEQGLQRKYDLEEATAKIKHGADIILGHWHYYKGDVDPLLMGEDSMARAFGAECSEEIQLLMDTYRAYGQTGQRTGADEDWERNPNHLVSQMFERNWQPMQSGWP